MKKRVKMKKNKDDDESDIRENLFWAEVVS